MIAGSGDRDALLGGWRLPLIPDDPAPRFRDLAGAAVDRQPDLGLGQH
jgi:hypothetical protein